MNLSNPSGKYPFFFVTFAFSPLHAVCSSSRPEDSTPAQALHADWLKQQYSYIYFARRTILKRMNVALIRHRLAIQFDERYSFCVWKWGNWIYSQYSNFVHLFKCFNVQCLLFSCSAVHSDAMSETVTDVEKKVKQFLGAAISETRYLVEPCEERRTKQRAGQLVLD